MTLSDELDEIGIPEAHVSIELSPKDKLALETMARKCHQLIQKISGSTLLSELSTADWPAASHLAGGCIMGGNPKLSVTDSFGKVHSLDNLFIADGSILPGQWCGDSPSLTIQALALRTAERVSKRLRT